MKINNRCSLAVIAISLSISTNMAAQSPTAATNNEPVELAQPAMLPDEVTAMEAAQARDLNYRLVQISEMDKSNMTRAEKKELRKETRAIRDQLQTLGDGIYITAGGIIIILLLLILLL